MTLDNINFFATAAKGLEEILASELHTLGIGNAAVEPGGVRFTGSMADCCRANLWLRTANRVLINLAEFYCDSPETLYSGVRAILWERYINSDMTLAVDCNLRDSAITHSGYAALKTKDAIVDRIRDRSGSRPNIDTADPDLRVNVHLAKNRCTVSLDTSGVPLDRRGYRLDRTHAPLRETLAAALVYISGWDGMVPLVDPMCGSGTILIEAALKAANIPPGKFRKQFGFQRWPEFDARLWEKILKEAAEKERKTLPTLLYGSDASSTAPVIAGKNAERAGVEKFISFSRSEMREFTPPPPPGILLFNPPYGQRLGEEEALKKLYKDIGDIMKQKYKGYTAYLFTGNPELAKSVGLKASRRIVLFNGPIECRLLKYELY